MYGFLTAGSEKYRDSFSCKVRYTSLSQFWPTQQTRKENFFDYLKKNINKFLIEVETRLTCPYLRASPLSRKNIFDTMT